MILTYKFKSTDYTNQNKLSQIRKLGAVYKQYYNKLIKQSIVQYYQVGSLPKYLPSLSSEFLSERFKQTCGSQVKGTINSGLSNIKNRFAKIVYSSSLSKDEKIALFYVNKYHLWFKKEINIKGTLVPNYLLKLNRRIFKQCKGRIPILRNVTMCLDKKVAKLSKSENSFDYWIRLSTLNKRCPIYLPLKSYQFYENSKGELQNQIQIIIKNDKIEYGLIKKEQDLKLKTEGSEIGVDLGLVILLSSSNGNMYSQGLYKKLKKYDEIIIRITKKRQKNGLTGNSSKLDKLYSKVRNLIKNEVGRALNRLIEKENPKEIVIENLTGMIQDSCAKLSKNTKRLLHNCGISKISKRLKVKSKKKGFKVSEINPAYTSKECPKCHCIDEKNRPNQKTFKCINCGYTRNADYVGAVNIRNRRSILSVNIYTPYKNVRELVQCHYSTG